MYMLRSYGNPEPIKYIQIRSLGRRLAEWYYEEGGSVFLTEMNQKMYENFVREVDNMVKQRERRKEGELNSDVDGRELERLKKISSIFRTNLC
jgi:hypothetical protein